MTDAFDPYRKWLGIPPEEQPPHYYRLLAIGLFESDADVIHEAADRQMAHVQTHKMGPHAPLSQRMLNELAAAKICLLKPEKKAAYDRALREKLAQSVQAVEPPPAPVIRMAKAIFEPAVTPAATIETVVEPPPQSQPRNIPRERSKNKTLLLIIEVVSGVLAVALLAWLFSKWRGGDTQLAEDTSTNQPHIEPKPQPKPKPEPEKPIEKLPSAVVPEPENPVIQDPTDDPPPADPDSDPPETDPADPLPTTTVEAKPIDPPVEIAPSAPDIGQVHVFNAHPGFAVSVLAISSNGKTLMEGSADKLIRFWDLVRGVQGREPSGRSAVPLGGAYLANGEKLTTIWGNGEFFVASLKGGQNANFQGIRLPVSSIDFSADGKVIAVADSENISVVDTASLNVLHKWANARNALVAVSGDGSRVVGILPSNVGNSVPGAEQFANFHSFNLVEKKSKQMAWNPGPFSAFALSPEGSQAALVGKEDGLHLVGVDVQLPAKRIIGAKLGRFTSVMYWPDGRWLVTGGADGKVRVWNLRDGVVERVFSGHTDAVTKLAVSVVGRCIVSGTGGRDCSVRVWRWPADGSSELPVEKPPVPVVQEAKPKPAAQARSLEEIFGPREPKGDAVPDAAARRDALKLVKDVYKDDYSRAKKGAEKVALAEKLLTQASESNDPVERYVLFDQARILARDGGNPALAIDAVEKMAQGFAIDVGEMAGDVADQATKDAMPAAARHELVERLMAIVDRFGQEDQWDAAKRLLEHASAVARKANDKEQIKQTTSRRTELAEFAKLYATAKEAAEKLQDSPDDGPMNLAVGRYLCFGKDDWETGRPLLAKGDDEKLKQLAELELAQPTAADEQAKIGDGWWELADGAKGFTKARLQARAEKWYAAALPNLKGLTQAKVTKRLDELASAAAHSTGTKPTTTPTPIEKPTAGGVTSVNGALASRIQKAIKKGAVSKSNLAGTNNNGLAFSELPPGGAVLAGFNLLLDRNGRIQLLQPVYHTSKQPMTGLAYGPAGGESTSVVAKKGYAVSSIELRGGNAVYSLRLTFMKLDRNGLDDKDSYTSDWIGKDPFSGFNSETTTLGGDGQPIIGIFGQADYYVYKLGVVQLPAPDAK